MGTRKRKLLFLYNNWDREHVIIEIFAKKINKNLDIKCYKVGMLDADLIKKIMQVRPNIVITFPIASYRQIVVYEFIKKMYNSIIMAYTTEGYLDLQNDEQVKMHCGVFDYSSSLIDYHLFWGTKVSEVLGTKLLGQNKVKRKEQIVVIGNPLYEKREITKLYSHNDYVQIMKRESKKYRKSVLIATGFHGGSYELKDIVSVGDIVDVKGKSKREVLNDPMVKKYQDAAEKEKIYRKEYISKVIESAKKYPEVLFIVKYHPQEIMRIRIGQPNWVRYLNTLKGYKNIVIVDQNIPIGAILPCCDFLVHYGSTVDMEAYIYKIPTLKFKMESDNDFLVQSSDKFSATYIENIFGGTLNLYIDMLLEGKNLFKENVEKEKDLNDYMGYKMDQEYTPSQNLVDFLSSDLKCNKIFLNAKDYIEIMKFIIRREV